MKKIFTFFVMLTFALPLTYTNAQVTDNPIAVPMQKARDARDLMQDKKEAMRGRLASTTRAWAESFTDRVVNRFTVALERMENIADRVESRIAKIEATRANLSEAKTHLADAREHLGDAEEVLKTIPPKIAEILDSETPREHMRTLRPLFGEIKTHLKETRADLSEAIASIKKGFNTKPATTSSSN